VRLVAAIMPVRSRPSTAPTRSRASISLESIAADLKRTVSARRAASTVWPARAALMRRNNDSGCFGSRRGAFRGELGGLMLGGQGIDQFAQRLAGNHLRQFVERQVDAVVGDAALRKIVGADAFGAVTGADFLLAIGRAHRVDALAFGVVDARAQNVHRRGLVLV